MWRPQRRSALFRASGHCSRPEPDHRLQTSLSSAPPPILYGYDLGVLAKVQLTPARKRFKAAAAASPIAVHVARRQENSYAARWRTGAIMGPVADWLVTPVNSPSHAALFCFSCRQQERSSFRSTSRAIRARYSRGTAFVDGQPAGNSAADHASLPQRSCGTTLCATWLAGLRM